MPIKPCGGEQPGGYVRNFLNDRYYGQPGANPRQTPRTNVAPLLDNCDRTYRGHESLARRQRQPRGHVPVVLDE
jgi:hypothetical protein